MKEITLDVSELPAPEPFDRILRELSSLDGHQYLRVMHRKQPLFLYKPLEKNNFAFHVQKGRDHAFEIFIWHKGGDVPDGLDYPSLVNTSGAT